MIRAWDPQSLFGMRKDDAVLYILSICKLDLLEIVYADKAALILYLIMIWGQFLLVLLLD